MEPINMINAMKNAIKTSAALLVAVVSIPSFSVEVVEIEEIIVVGQKIQRSLQDTKDSVLVMTQSTLENRGVMDLQQALVLTPGASGNSRSFRIRGVDSGRVDTLRSELARVSVDSVPLTGWIKSEDPPVRGCPMIFKTG